MANRRIDKILLKRSNVIGKIPTALELGELALNTADVKLYASGTTANSILPIGWDRISRTGDTVTGNFTINGNILLSGDITSDSFIVAGGSSSQFLKADGSLDSTAYESLSNKQINLSLGDGTNNKYPTVDAVNFQDNTFAKAVTQIGFISVNDSFSLYRYDDYTLGISGSTDGIVFPYIFYTPPFVPYSAITNITSRLVPLSGIGITGLAQSIWFVGYRKSDDSVVFSTNSFIQSQTVCQLGAVIVKYNTALSATSSATSFSTPTVDFVNQPDIAAYSNLETTGIGLKSSIFITYNGNDLKIRNIAGNLIGISVNWHGANNDLKPIPASNSGGTIFSVLYPTIGTTFSAVTTGNTIDPTRYWNSSANTLTNLPTSGSASIQRFLVSTRGIIGVQYGESFYSTFEAAKTNVFTESFTDVIPLNAYTEIGRLVVISGATNLSDTTTAAFYITNNAGGGGSINGSGGGGTSTGSGVTVWGTIIGTYTNQTDAIAYTNTAIANSHVFTGGTGVGSIKQILGNNVASGNYSLAHSSGNTASGAQSHAEGLNTIANGTNSHSEGQQTIASGTSSHAEGQSTRTFGTASHAEGFSTTANTAYSHAEGELTSATGQGSHVGGYNSRTNGNYAFVHGSASTANGENIIILGSNITASTPNTTYVGKPNLQNLVVGTSVNNLGIDVSGNIVIGTTGQTSYWSAGTGTNAVATKNGDNTASGNYSVAEGRFTTASGLYSHSEGNQTVASGQSSHAGGFNSQANGDFSFIHGNNSRANGSNTIVLGANITGNTADTTFVDRLNIKTFPAGTSLVNLGIDANGNVIIGRDVYVTGGTYNNSTGIATYTNNTGGTFNVSGFFTGSTEVFVTGGTYSNATGTATFTNNTGGTFNVSGFFTTANDVFVTGGTYSNATGIATFTNNTGGTFTVSGFKTNDVFVTGGTYSNATGIATYTNNTGGTFTVSGFKTNDVFVTGGTYSNATGIATYTNNTGGTFNISGFFTTANDVFVTGGTYNNNTGTATFTNKTGGTFSVIGFFTGSTEVFVTGGTYNQSTGIATYTNNTGGTFTVSGFKTNDVFVTGGTYNNNTGTATFTNNTGGTFSITSFFTGSTEVFVTGGTYNQSTGIATYTNNTGGTFTVSGFKTNDVFVTGGTFSNGTGTATFTNNTGGTFNVNGFFTTANDVFVTGGTYSNGVTTFRNNTGGTFTVNGYFSAETDTLQSVTTRGSATTSNILANSYIKSGGTSSQYLMADGSVTTGANFQPVSATGTGVVNNIALQELGGTDKLISGIRIGHGNQTAVTTNTVFGVSSGFAFAPAFSTHNTAMGYLALSGTTSGNNTAIGSLALYGPQVQNHNTAVGYAVLSLTTAFNNTGVGSNAMNGALGGQNNTSVGAYSFRNNGNGSNNIAIGYQSAEKVLNGSNLTLANNCIYIGSNVNSFANSITNEIVIGDSAYGLGTNTIMLGNNLVSRTALRGNILIGTTADTTGDILQISGSVISTAFKKSGGTSNQFLKADGSVDSRVFLTGDTFVTGGTYAFSGGPSGISGGTLTLRNNTGGTFSVSGASLIETNQYKQNNLNPDTTGTKYPTVDAVNLQANTSLKISSSTGFIDRLDTFNMALSSNTAISITGSSVGAFVRTRLFANPITPEDTVVNFSGRTFLASNFVFTGDGRFFRFIGYEPDTDSVVSALLSFLLTDSVVQFGFVEVLRSGGINTFTSLKVLPDISTISLFDNVMVANQSTSNIFPNTDLTVNLSAGVLKAPGVNWGNLNQHSLPLSATSVVSFIRIDPSYLTTTTGFLPTTTVDTTTYWNGSALVSVGGPNNASIQRWLITLDGRIWLQAGTTAYSNKADAESALASVVFENILLTDISIELCRMITTKSANNLTDTTKAQFYYTSAGGGASTSSASFGTLGGSPYDNFLLGNELYNKISVFSGTTNVLPKSISLTGLTNSNIIDSGTLITLSSNTRVIGAITATTIVKSGGTSNQFLMADGSVSTAGAGVSGSGTINVIPKFSGSSNNIANSNISDNGVLVSISSNTRVIGAITATTIVKSGGTSSQFLMADGSVSFGASTSGVTGSGTINFIPKFSGSSNNIADSIIYDNGTQIGINTVTPTFGYTLNVSGATKVDNGDVYISSGGLLFGNTAQNAIYKGGTDFFIMRNYTQDYTINQIWAPPSTNVLTDEREATLALVREDTTGNSEFMDVYNNGYISETQHGLRIQKRGTGQFRDFVIDYSTGITGNIPVLRLNETKVSITKPLLINTNTDNGVDKLQVNGFVISSNGYKISGGTSSQFLMADGSTSTGGGGGSATLSGGITNNIVKWSSSSAITTSNISDNGSLITFSSATRALDGFTAVTINTSGLTVNGDLILSGTSLFTGASTFIGVDSNNEVVKLPSPDDMTIIVTNKTGVSIAKGSVVYINGAFDGKPTIALAIADSAVTTSLAIGITSEVIANNASGSVIIGGRITGLNTSTFTAGDEVYLSTTVAGGLSTSIAVSPNAVVLIGTVGVVHGTEGEIIINIFYGFRLDRLLDVTITGATDGQLLTYDGPSGLWKNENPVPSKIVITTAVSITTDTLDASGNTQDGKHVMINNGASNINITVNGGPMFMASYEKRGSGTITFVQGAGRTLALVDATALLDGRTGSTATISSFNLIDNLRISNA